MVRTSLYLNDHTNADLLTSSSPTHTSRSVPIPLALSHLACLRARARSSAPTGSSLGLRMSRRAAHATSGRGLRSAEGSAGVSKAAQTTRSKRMHMRNRSRRCGNAETVRSLRRGGGRCVPAARRPAGATGEGGSTTSRSGNAWTQRQTSRVVSVFEPWAIGRQLPFSFPSHIEGAFTDERSVRRRRLCGSSRRILSYREGLYCSPWRR